MPLRDDRGEITDTWVRIAPGEALQPRSLLDIEDAEERGEALEGQEFGIHVGNDVARERLKPWLAKAGVVSVAFPSFSDGRGFSLGRAIRAMGYEGRLRATGPVIADQYAYLRACGFDEVDIPESVAARQPEELWAAAVRRISLGYQRGYARARSIPEARSGS